MPRDDGLYRTWVTDDLDIEVDYSKGGRDKEVRVPSDVFARIDRRDLPSVWVPKANAALIAYNKDIADSIRFQWWTERRVEDHGPGDVREIYEENWSTVVDGEIVDRDPIGDAP